MGTIISLAEAQARIKRWLDATVQGPDFRASMVSQADLTGLMAEIGESGIRCYNGIDDTGAYKLIIVAVDANGNDLWDSSQGDNIYDFTTPCPQICDRTSPLYTLEPK
jgi:hypothetical protein